jgi:hypothetical protein
VGEKESVCRGACLCLFVYKLIHARIVSHYDSDALGNLHDLHCREQETVIITSQSLKLKDHMNSTNAMELSPS